MKIAVLGAGNIGGTLAKKWAKAGHSICFGLRDPGKPYAQELVKSLGSAASASSIAEAIDFGEIVVFAIPGPSMEETHLRKKAAVKEGCSMRPILGVVLIGVLSLVCQGSGMAATTGKSFVAVNDVTWKTLGTDENDSMPIGNGDLAANVWTEQNGDLVLLVAKSDAWSEMGKLLKLGRVRIHIAPNPFAGAVQFT